MSKALHEFLALRQASEAAPPATSDGYAPGEDRVTADSEEAPDKRQPQLAAATPHEFSSLKSDSVVKEADLAAYFVELIAAHPSGKPVADRQGLARYLARGVIHKYGDPREICWQSETPPRLHQRAGARWIARCPEGHLTDESIESHQVLGWSCKACQRVYDATECRLVPRVTVGGTAPEGNGGGEAH